MRGRSYCTQSVLLRGAHRRLAGRHGAGLAQVVPEESRPLRADVLIPGSGVQKQVLYSAQDLKRASQQGRRRPSKMSCLNGIVSSCHERSARRGASSLTTALPIVLVLLASCTSPTSADNPNVLIEPASMDHAADEDTLGGPSHPRILTVLTTYNKRTSYIKAYREAMANRPDGYAPTIFVTSDEQDEDPDEVVDFHSGLPNHHRLLSALTEAYSRYDGQYDWIAVGDDDTVFLYNRARAFLKNIDHTQPVAIARVDGLRKTTGLPEQDSKCYTPEEKLNTSDVFASQRCCQDFTRPCEVTRIRKYPGFLHYGRGGLFWPYGGSGAFLSAGVMNTIADGRGKEGWTNCTMEFGVGSTDCQLGMCMVGRGLSFSTYPDGFYKSSTADPSKLGAVLALNCQVLGMHLGIRHLQGGAEYTPEKFKLASAAVYDVDEEWSGQQDDYMAKHCQRAWALLSEWK